MESESVEVEAGSVGNLVKMELTELSGSVEAVV